MTSDPALDVMHHVADRIVNMPLPSPPRVAIDGPDGAGKTHFADQLAVVLQSRHRQATVRVSIDGFHNLRAVRYQQGRNSPLGFWADSYNYDRFRRDVLEPFSLNGSRYFRRASYSHATDEILYPEPEIAEPTAVLLVDGIFLQRAELRVHWDLTIFLDVAFNETAKRMALRDGTPSDPEHPRMRRYVEGQREYFRQCDPRQRADILIDNNDFDHPAILRDGTPQLLPAASVLSMDRPVRLRPLRMPDLPVVLEWASDQEFCRANEWSADLPPERIRRWLQQSMNSETFGLVRLGVELHSTLVGYVDLANLTATSAEFGIAIGDSDRWGQGIGTAAGHALLEHAFNDLELHRIDAVVQATNSRSLRLIARLGFTRSAPGRSLPSRADGPPDQCPSSSRLIFQLHSDQWPPRPAH